MPENWLCPVFRDGNDASHQLFFPICPGGCDKIELVLMILTPAGVRIISTTENDGGRGI
jgi:hypothetical protein